MKVDYLTGLDPEQRKAVLASPIATKVMAGAGSGKTRVLTSRIANQIDTGVVKPENMFVAAFTRAAADEMNERVNKLVDAELLNVGTFHGLMWRMLNDERYLNAKPKLDICKDSERTRILQGLLGKPGKDYPQAINSAADIGVVSGWISTWKNELIRSDGPEMSKTLDEAAPLTDIWSAASIYPLYEKKLEQLGKADFDDMLKMAYELLVSDPSALARARNQWTAFFIDECQDTNHAQWEIIKLLADPKSNSNITVVGDTRQALYRFRGAVPELMDRFNKMYKNSQTVDLIRNYRSTPEVVEHANRLISPFKMKSQKAHRGSGSTPIGLSVRTPTDQAQQITEFVRALRDSGKDGGDVAVLIRTNAQSAEIESAFVAARIPYWCQGGGFFDRMEIGDMMAYLRLANDHTDINSLHRIINKPTRYLGREFVEQVARNAANYNGDLVSAIRFTTRYRGKSLFAKQLESSMRLADLIESITPGDGALIHPVTAIKTVMEKTDYLEWLRVTSGTSEGADDSRKENLDVLIDVAGRHGNVAGLIQFADEATALQVQSNDATEICTVHRSKGREWPYVIATNFYDGSIPHKMASAGVQREDERRIAYVAFTRAQDHLVVMAPQINEKMETVNPSPFLTQAGLTLDEPEADVAWWSSIL